MKINNIIFFFTIIIFSLFLYLDNKAYYYGIGNGFLSSKIPKRFEVFFGGSDFGNQGIILIEKDLNLIIICKDDSIFDESTKNKILVKKFIGYWFDNSNIIAKIKDKNNNYRYIQVYEEITNKTYPKFIIKEVKYLSNKLNNLKYVDLNKSLEYFKSLKLFINLTYVYFILIFFYLLKVIYNKKIAFK